MSEDLRKRYTIKSEINGAVITSVESGSDAADKGLKPGQVIVQVGQETVTSPTDVQKQIEALRKAKKKSALLLVSDGQGQQEFVTLPLD